MRFGKEKILHHLKGTKINFAKKKYYFGGKSQIPSENAFPYNILAELYQQNAPRTSHFVPIHLKTDVILLFVL